MHSMTVIIMLLSIKNVEAAYEDIKIKKKMHEIALAEHAFLDNHHCADIDKYHRNSLKRD